MTRSSPSASCVFAYPLDSQFPRIGKNYTWTVSSKTFTQSDSSSASDNCLGPANGASQPLKRYLASRHSADINQVGSWAIICRLLRSYPMSSPPVVAVVGIYDTKYKALCYIKRAIEPADRAKPSSLISAVTTPLTIATSISAAHRC